MKTAIITGASSGLGREIAFQFKHSTFADHARGWNVIDWSRETGVDIRDAESIKLAKKKDLEVDPKIDALINCAGINGIEMWPNLKEQEFDNIYMTNVKGIFLTSQALLENLRGGTILNIVSNASHVPMTSSAAYNASKGAAAILTKQMARELGKTHNITVFGVSPNKLKGTGMSAYIDEQVCKLRGWTKEQAAQYQIASLPAGEETDPRALAEFIAFLLSSKERHKYLAGCDIPYGGP